MSITPTPSPVTGRLSFTPSGFQFAWDSTSLSTFIECPRKYQLSILEGWATSGDKSVHLIFGGLYASALEHYHKHIAAGVDVEEATRLVLRELLVETWDADLGEGVDWGHPTKTRDTLIRSVIWYLDQFRDDTMSTVILPDGRAAVEYSFSFELTDDYLYCGHIDRLVSYGGDIYVQDQKTSGSTLTPRFFEGFSPDIQMTGYTLAGKIIFDLPVKGVVIDAAQIAVGFTRFERWFVGRTNAHLSEFRHEALHYIGLAKRCHEESYYPMNRTSCGNYGGCRYRKICSLAPNLRDQFLQGNFVRQEPWDPLKKR